MSILATLNKYLSNSRAVRLVAVFFTLKPVSQINAGLFWVKSMSKVNEKRHQNDLKYAPVMLFAFTVGNAIFQANNERPRTFFQCLYC